MDPATMLLGTIFLVCTTVMTVGGGYAYVIHRRIERRKRKN